MSSRTGLSVNIDIVLLDIEGTVCPISFVKETLFPYALKSLPSVLDEQWDSPEFGTYRSAFPEDCRNNRNEFEKHFRDLVQRDVKVSYLKSLQGYLWSQGYESGALRAPLFEDVQPFIANAYNEGKKIMIYSSGSVPAQKLFFGHTSAQPSNQCPFISGWFDTVNAGPKTEATSYSAILSACPTNGDASRWLFLSDNLSEVKAARQVGMQSLPVTRPGNATLPVDDPLTSEAINTFDHESIIDRTK